jgi:hypothetical protein
MVLMDRERDPITLAAGRFETREARQDDRESELEIDVIFTDTDGTLAALKLAGNLACNLGPRIHLQVPQVVPLHFPLTRPPISIAFTEQRLLELAHRGAQRPLETAIHLYLCRDKKQALSQVLKPRSLVIIGGKKRWWPTEEGKLARMLRSKGHQVVFAAVK